MDPLIPELFNADDLLFNYDAPNNSWDMTDDVIKEYTQKWLDGKISLKEWIAFKDPAYNWYLPALPEPSPEQLKLIHNNEKKLFKDFMLLIKEERFMRSFVETPFENKAFKAFTDLRVIESLINKTVSDEQAEYLVNAYDLGFPERLMRNIDILKSGQTFQHHGYKLIFIAETDALLQYGDYLKQYLSDKKIDITPDEKASITPTNSEKPISFKFKDSVSKFKYFLESLNVQLSDGLVNTNKSDISELLHILTSDPVPSDSKPVYFSCETTLLAYILRKINLSFQSLTDMNIERTGLFITKNEVILTKSNICKSISSCRKRPKEYEKVDKAVSELYSANSR